MKRWMLGGVMLLAVAGCDDDTPQRKKAEAAPIAAEVAAPSEEERVRLALEQAEREKAALAQALEAQAALEKTVAEEKAKADAKATAEAERTAGVLGSGALLQGGAFASITGTGDISSGFDDVDIQGGLLGNEAGEMQGGFGFGGSGSGPGGGGTGWGTIGTGRYGTLGHGSGTGSGYGVGGGRGGMRGRSAAVPQVRIGQPSCTGDLDKAIIRRYIKRNIQKITYCYEKQLLAKAGLEGTVTAKFTIGENGMVPESEARGVDGEVSTCVGNVIHAIEFPKPKSGTVTCSYPFTFRPTGG